MSNAPRPYAHVGEGVTFDPDDGGQIRVGGSSVYPAGTILATEGGVGLGPLVFAVPENGHLELTRLMYLPSEGDEGDDDGLLSFGVAGSAAGAASSQTEPASDGDDAPVAPTRRTVLGLAVGLLGGALVGPAAGQETEDDKEDLVTLQIAEADIAYLDAPLSLTLTNNVQGVLPASTDVMADIDGGRVGETATAGETMTLAPSTGQLTVYLRDSRSRIARILAWARGLLSDESLSYDGRELQQPASEYVENEFVRLSSHSAIVNPIIEDISATALTIGDTPIPHADDANDAGGWDIVGGTLIYEVGPDPPDATSWTVETRLGPLEKRLQ